MSPSFYLWQRQISWLNQKHLKPWASLLGRYCVKSQQKWVIIYKPQYLKDPRRFSWNSRTPMLLSFNSRPTSRWLPTVRGLKTSQVTLTILIAFTFQDLPFSPYIFQINLQNDVSHVTINLKIIQFSTHTNPLETTYGDFLNQRPQEPQSRD